MINKYHVIKNRDEYEKFKKDHNKLHNEFIKEYIHCFTCGLFISNDTCFKNTSDDFDYYMSQNIYTLFIMCDKNKKYKSCALLRSDNDDVYTIKSVCVGRSYRGKGICSYLIRYIIKYVTQYIKKDTPIDVYIDCKKDNIAASRCYNKIFKIDTINDDFIYFKIII